MNNQQIAEERYQDLCEYFHDEKTAKTILEDRDEFKAWLERIRWNTLKVDELARKLESLEKAPEENGTKIYARVTKGITLTKEQVERFTQYILNNSEWNTSNEPDISDIKEKFLKGIGEVGDDSYIPADWIIENLRGNVDNETWNKLYRARAVRDINL